MREDLNSRNFLFFLAGSALIGLSSGVGMVYAFKGVFPAVCLSFLGFIIGYKLSQIELYEDRASGYLWEKFGIKLIEFKHILAGIIGTAAFSYGFIVFAKSIKTFDPVLSISAGILIGAGYISAHFAVNDALV